MTVYLVVEALLEGLVEGEAVLGPPDGGRRLARGPAVEADPRV